MLSVSSVGGPCDAYVVGDVVLLVVDSRPVLIVDTGWQGLGAMPNADHIAWDL